MTEAVKQTQGFEEDDLEQAASLQTSATVAQLERTQTCRTPWRQVSGTAAMLLAVGASVGLGMYVRRRAARRASRLVNFDWNPLSPSLARPGHRTRASAPLGAVGGASLLAARQLLVRDTPESAPSWGN